MLACLGAYFLQSIWRLCCVEGIGRTDGCSDHSLPLSKGNPSDLTDVATLELRQGWVVVSEKESMCKCRGQEDEGTLGSQTASGCHFYEDQSMLTGSHKSCTWDCCRVRGASVPWATDGYPRVGAQLTW